jgi:hypothetical protein
VRGTNGGRIRWPEGKDFAFTIFDDTDYARMDNVPPVYEFLKDHGFRSTKSVWPLRAAGAPAVEGATCEDPDYLEWVYRLQELGFEITCHGVANRSSVRGEIIRGLDRFKQLFGHDPLALSNHTDCREGMYWGRDRLSGVHRLAYGVATRFRDSDGRGHVEGDPHFWGDVCRERVKYVRNFVFADINTLRACPIMPYHDPTRPCVNYWFAASEGATVDSFNHCIREGALDRLEAEGGACIMYTHLAFGFYGKGGLNSTFESLMQRLSKKNGWFVPVGTLLDYLLETSGHHDITDRERRGLERRWLSHKLRIGPS